MAGAQEVDRAQVAKVPVARAQVGDRDLGVVRAQEARVLEETSIQEVAGARQVAMAQVEVATAQVVARDPEMVMAQVVARTQEGARAQEVGKMLTTVTVENL